MKGETKAGSDTHLNFKILTISRNESMRGKKVIFFFFSCFLQFSSLIAANVLSRLTYICDSTKYVFWLLEQSTYFGAMGSRVDPVRFLSNK